MISLKIRFHDSSEIYTINEKSKIYDLKKQVAHKNKIKNKITLHLHDQKFDDKSDKIIIKKANLKNSVVIIEEEDEEYDYNQILQDKYIKIKIDGKTVKYKLQEGKKMKDILKNINKNKKRCDYLKDIFNKQLPDDAIMDDYVDKILIGDVRN
jgi:hypothetical protein